MRFSPVNGASKVAKWYKTQPAAHISTLLSYGCYFTNSGAKYKGVPTRVAYNASAHYTIFDTPKSPIF